MGKLITNSRGTFRRIGANTPLKAGWTVVEEDMGTFEDPHVTEKNRKRDIVAKLNQLGIPHDGRSSASDLEALYESYVELQAEEEV